MDTIIGKCVVFVFSNDNKALYSYKLKEKKLLFRRETDELLSLSTDKLKTKDNGNELHLRILSHTSYRSYRL